MQKSKGFYISYKACLIAVLSLFVFVSGYFLKELRRNMGSSFRGSVSLAGEYGYSIDSYPLKGRTELSLISKNATQVLSIGSPKIEKIIKQKWLNESTIYLELEISYVDSFEEKSTKAQVIYDFQATELYTLCDLPLWRQYSSGKTIDERWMSPKDFNAKLHQLIR